MEMVLDIIHKTLLVSGFVLLLMILIEYLHVRTMGNWNQGWLKNRFIQILIAIFLGLTPGCAGAFAVVSLYTHHFFSFPALLAVSVATFGDEAFMIFATSPETGIKLLLYLGVLSLVVSVPLLLFRFKMEAATNQHIFIHDDACCKPNLDVSHQLRKITFQRALLLSIFFLLFLNMFLMSHAHEGHSHGGLSPESLVFLAMLALTSFIVITVPEHFLTEHVWNHVLKKHFVRLFLWALATIAIVHALEHYIHVEEIVSSNIWIMLLLAVIIGLLPLSGPHLIFFTLFMQHMIPFEVLLANSIVQEGHAGIPLLAEDKKAFFVTKAIKVAIALFVGWFLIYFEL